jgi:tetratricopeptide (TPR) repeat protein
MLTFGYGTDAEMEAEVAKALAAGGASAAARNVQAAARHYAHAAARLRNTGRYARALDALRPVLPLLPKITEDAPDLVGQVVLEAVDLHRLSGDTHGGLALFRAFHVHELAPALSMYNKDRVEDVLMGMAKALEHFDLALCTELRLEAAQHAGRHGTPTQRMDILKSVAECHLRADLYEQLARHVLTMPLYVSDAKIYFLCALAIRYAEEATTRKLREPMKPLWCGSDLPSWVTPWAAAATAAYVEELPERKQAKFRREVGQFTQALQDVVNGIQPDKPFADKYGLVVHVLVSLHCCILLQPRKSPAEKQRAQLSRRGRRRGGGGRPRR